MGAVLVLAYPATALAIALPWHHGLIDPGRDAPFVALVESLALPALLVAPIGVVVLISGLGIRNPLAWVALMLLGLPLAALLWFVAVAGLGGLTGKPF